MTSIIERLAQPLVLRRAARIGAFYASRYPDPAGAVNAARQYVRGRLGNEYANEVRFSVSRPGVPGRDARVIVMHGRLRYTATQEVE